MLDVYSSIYLFESGTPQRFTLSDLKCTKLKESKSQSTSLPLSAKHVRVAFQDPLKGNQTQ